MARKLGMVMITVFIKYDVQVQVATALVWIIGALALQAHKMPYASNMLNRLELFGLITAAFTMYFGLLLNSTQFNETTKIAVIFSVLLINGAWIVSIFMILAQRVISRCWRFFFAKADQKKDPSKDAVQLKGLENIFDETILTDGVTFVSNPLAKPNSNSDEWDSDQDEIETF